MRNQADLNVVLVGTLYANNVGAAARCMGNMGGGRLILVNPRCEMSHEMKQGAAGAQKRLEEVTIYQNWPDFYAQEGEGLRIGFTRRDGKQRQVWPLKERLQKLKDQESDSLNGPWYLIFGPEDDGLSAEDLALVNYRCSLPTYGEFPSMNLAQAVLLSLFVCQDFLHDGRPRPSKTQNHISRQGSPLFFPDEAIREWIEAMGFNVNDRRASAYITLKRLLLQNAPSPSDLKILEAILQQNIRKLRERKSST